MPDPLTIAGAGWAISGAGWVLSPIISRLLNEGFSHLGKGIKKRMEKLETMTLPEIGLVVEAAEKNPHQAEKLQRWLRKLKEAVYTAEDVLELYKYNLVKQKVAESSSSSNTSSRLPHFVQNIIFRSTQPLKQATSMVTSNISMVSPHSMELRASLKALEKTAGQAKHFLELLNISSGKQEGGGALNWNKQHEITTRLPPKRVFGRDKERDQIICLLRDQELYLFVDPVLEPAASRWQNSANQIRHEPSNEQESNDLGHESRAKSIHYVIAITGAAGAGKTALAQYVCDYEKDAKYFDLIIWVYVSKRFDVFSLMRQMIESASKKVSPHFENLDVLQEKFSDCLRSKKFLLVLDDVWCEKMEERDLWEKILAPLSAGKQGSKILLTSQSRDSAANLGAENKCIKNLKDLEKDAFLELLMHYAIGGGEAESSLPSKLEAIKLIAEKLSRSPLEAKHVGSVLRGKRLNELVSMAGSNKFDGGGNKVLLLSYQNLDTHLQRCFSYCSIFPRGHIFHRDHLFKLWMAEGFIIPPTGSGNNLRIEDVAAECFKNLVSRCFFEPLEHGEPASFFIHELLHKLAEEVSEDDCFRIDSDKPTEIISTVRHLSVQANSLSMHMENICQLKNLRTLVFIEGNKVNFANFNKSLKKVLEKLVKLRVLDLKYCNITMLPASVSNLKLLRYLDISFTLIDKLPQSLLELYHLETFDLDGCNLDGVPSNLSRLINLRYLNADGRISSLIPNIGRLTSLHILKEFHVRRENGFEIRQLENLRELSGVLHLLNLENVEGGSEAIHAKLNDKKHLKGLLFEWSESSNLDFLFDSTGEVDAEVLEGLQPSSSVTMLHLRNYKARFCPTWMTYQNGYFSKIIEHLGFYECHNLKFIPNIGQFLNLRKLELCKVLKLKRLPGLPPCLKEFKVIRCWALAWINKQNLCIHLNALGLVDRDLLMTMEAETHAVKASRENMKILMMTIDLENEAEQRWRNNCATLRDEHSHQTIQSLEFFRKSLLMTTEATMELRDVEDLVLPRTIRRFKIDGCSITDVPLTTCLRGLTSLSKLTLSDLTMISSLPSEDVFRNLTALKSLKIEECLFLKTLGGLHAIPSLETLQLDSCPNLSGMIDGGGGGTTSLLPSSLLSLKVFRCPYLDDFFPRGLVGLTSLTSLTVWDCPQTTTIALGQLVSLKSLSLLQCSSLISLQGLNEVRSLEILHVLLCPVLVSAFDGDAEEYLSSLHNLSLAIDDLSLLRRLFTRQGLKNLKRLVLHSSQLFAFPSEQAEEFQHLTSLWLLWFKNCSMTLLPASLKSLTSLEFLEIEDCPNLSSIPYLPGSIAHLNIQRCNTDLLQRLREHDGSDWHKVARIPTKIFR